MKENLILELFLEGKSFSFIVKKSLLPEYFVYLALKKQTNCFPSGFLTKDKVSKMKSKIISS